MTTRMQSWLTSHGQKLHALELKYVRNQLVLIPFVDEQKDKAVNERLNPVEGDQLNEEDQPPGEGPELLPHGAVD